MEQTKPSQSLPDNAYRELKPGEEYVPMMPADAKPKEVTPYSVTMGLLMAVLFSAAAAYLGLRIGQVFEAAIPIAIIAVGVGNMLGKKNMLGQNVIIQSIGASSGIIVAGAIFTLPALYILGLETAFYKVFLSSVLGGILGIVLLIPFRKYFVKEMHGKYPFPEATATTEVLVSGEKGGNQAKLLAVAGLVGGLYDFAASTFGLWTEEISTRMTAWGTLCADKFKTLLKVNTSAAVLGLGYIIGLKYSAIIAAGSFLIWLLVVPVVGSTATGAGMSPEELYQTFGRPLGIGGIAMAGLIGIIRQSGIIKQAMGLAVSEFSGKKKAETNVPRTQRDLTMRTILWRAFPRMASPPPASSGATRSTAGKPTARPGISGGSPACGTASSCTTWYASTTSVGSMSISPSPTAARLRWRATGRKAPALSCSVPWSRRLASGRSLQRILAT